jgi:hypothetical protein
MERHLPIWLAIPNGGSNVSYREHRAKLPVAFSSPVEMTTWLQSPEGKEYWYVRVLDRARMQDGLHDLQTKGYVSIESRLDGRPRQEMTIEDFWVITAPENISC